MMEYRKRPLEVEAFRWTGGPDQTEDPVWACEAVANGDLYFEKHGGTGEVVCRVKTLEGIMTANQGDWIIKGIKGELCPCKPDIFKATYDLAARREVMKRETYSEIDALKSATLQEQAAEIERLKYVLGAIIQDLPSSRDWLDPALEREAKSIIEPCEHNLIELESPVAGKVKYCTKCEHIIAQQPS